MLKASELYILSNICTDDIFVIQVRLCNAMQYPFTLFFLALLKNHILPSVWYTIEPGNSKLFEKQQKVYYCQEFTIEEVIYVINGLKSNQKKFTIARLFTIDQFTIARFNCMSDFCAYLAWPHFFSRIPRNFLMVSKQLHIRALSKCCKVSSCLVSLCLKNRGHLFNRGGI